MANIQIKFLLLSVCFLASQTTKGVHGQCMTPPLNQVVYEGDVNTIMTCNNDPNKVSWTITPTNNELFPSRITNYSDTVTPSLTTFFDVTQTNLVIKSATNPVGTGTSPMATSGVYDAQTSTSSSAKSGAKLVVVRSGPTCNCSAISATQQNISCGVTYADASFNPIYAKVTWIIDGVPQTATATTLNVRTKVNNAFTSTATLTTSLYDTRVYQCNLTFTKPQSVSHPYIATNLPAFYNICTPNFCGMATTQPPQTRAIATAMAPTTMTTAPPTTTDCDCAQATVCPSPEHSCTEVSECRSGETNLTDVYGECVVKAELYARCDNCCEENLVCGVVVTLRNDSRWLIHDPLCNDNKCEMVVFDASCMSTDWKLLSERKVAISGVDDYVQAGNSVEIGLNVTDCSESCRRMMTLP